MAESGTRTSSYSYDLNGNGTSKTLPNGDVETGSFDALNRMAAQVETSGTTHLFQYGYSYDLAGNVTAVAQIYSGSLTSGTVANTYDSINRLTREADTVTGTTDYTYDAGNNRLSNNVAGSGTLGSGSCSYTYNSVNQLVAVSGTESETFTYDANGNRKTRVLGSGTDTYSYDFDNRLVGLVKGIGGTGITTGTYAYTYDYRTRRVKRDESGTSGGVATKVVYSGGTSVEELSGTTPVVEYVRGSDYGGGVGGVLYTIRSGTFSYTHENRRGDVVAKTNGSGSLTYQAQYQAFGDHPIQSGSTADRQKANTKDEDPTGFVNDGFRYRDLDTGVFISKDPTGFVDGPNLYTYVKQNPWTSFDPMGLAGYNDLLDWAGEQGNKGGVINWCKGYGATFVAVAWNAASFGSAAKNAAAGAAYDNGQISSKQYAGLLTQNTASSTAKAVVTYGSAGTLSGATVPEAILTGAGAGAGVGALDVANNRTDAVIAGTPYQGTLKSDAAQVGKSALVGAVTFGALKVGGDCVQAFQEGLAGTNTVPLLPPATPSAPTPVTPVVSAQAVRNTNPFNGPVTENVIIVDPRACHALL